MKVTLRWFLYLYIVCLGSEEYFDKPGPVFKIAVGLFAIFFLILLAGKIKIRFSSTGTLMILFATFALSSALWSLDPDRTLYFAFMLIQLLATTWITIACLESDSDLNQLVWCLVLSSVFPAISVCTNYFQHGAQAQAHVQTVAIQMNHGDRISFGGADPNLSAYRMVVSVIAAIHLNLTTRLLSAKLVLSALTAFFVAAALLTGSRGGGVALIVSSSVLLLVNAGRHKVTTLLTMAGLAALLLVTIPLLPPNVSARYLNMQEEVAKGSMAGRKTIYQESFESFKQRPLLGVGYFTYSSYSQQRGGLGLAAHNDLLEMVLDLGLVGIGTYLILMASLVWGASTVSPPWKALALGLMAAYFVASLSITIIATKLTWITFGIILGAVGLPKPAFGPGLSPYGDWSTKGSDPHA